MLKNYLDPGATANGKPARMARFWAPTLNTPGGVAIVATFDTRGKTWKAYIGSVDPQFTYDMAADQVASWGVKLEEADARHFFPDVALPYAD